MNLKVIIQDVAKIVVPAVAGAAIAFLVHLSAHLSPGQTAWLFPAATGAYFSLIHYLRQRWPGWAWLIGDLPSSLPPAPKA